MASEALSNEIAKALPPELRPCVDALVTEDETPLDNIFSEKQQRLLTEPLYSSWAREGEKFVALANVGLFYAVSKPPFVPDMLLSLDVQVADDLWPKQNRSYFVWEFGKPPDVVVEVVSNKEGGENTIKLDGYARIGVRYYVIYDPELLLSNERSHTFRLEGMSYRKFDEPSLFPGVNLGLREWQGRYEGHENLWLRWVDQHGTPILTGAERAQQERERAEQERGRANQERERAERLVEQLRRHGIDPEA